MSSKVAVSGNMDLPWWVVVVDEIENGCHPSFYSAHKSQTEADLLASDMNADSVKGQDATVQQNKETEEKFKARGLTPRLETIHKHKYVTVPREGFIKACLGKMGKKQLLDIYTSHNPPPVARPGILSKLPPGTQITSDVVLEIKKEEEAHQADLNKYQLELDGMDEKKLVEVLAAMPSSKMHTGYLIQKPAVE